QMARRGLRHVTHLVPTSVPFGRRLTKAFQYAEYVGDERLVSYFYWIDPHVQQSLYTAELQEYLADLSSATPFLAALTCLPENTPALNRMLYLEGKFFLVDHNLNFTDKMGMAAGVEVRVPLLDPELIALAARLPIAFKQRGAIGKWIFKKAMEP